MTRPTLLLACALVAACLPRPERAYRPALDGETAPRAFVGPSDEAPPGELGFARASLAAAAILADSARATDPRDRDLALARLESAGTGALPVLLHLAGDREHPVARAHALSVLARRGDRSARRLLGRLVGSADPAVRAQALVALDPRRDGELLRVAAASEHARVRLAALARVEAPRGETWRALLEARLADPSETPGVRALAARRLALHGAAAEAALVAALDDRDPFVGSSAAAALVEAIGAAAVPRLARLVSDSTMEPPRALAVDPVVASAAARVAVRHEGAERAALERLADAALARIEAALAHPDEAIRAQAAGALRSSARRPGALDALRAATVSTETPRHRLLLVLAMRALGAEARELERLLAALAREPGIVGAQAAEAALERGGAWALPRLLEAAVDADARVRAVAAEALARHADEVGPSLFAIDDPDPAVRARWAAAVLARLPVRAR